MSERNYTPYTTVNLDDETFSNFNKIRKNETKVAAMSGLLNKIIIGHYDYIKPYNSRRPNKIKIPKQQGQLAQEKAKSLGFSNLSDMLTIILQKENKS
ncbi:hypothetical protein ACR56S_04540 [Staphylococcus hominis]|uniref:hypothetical protein n=1 Tax=Staphylococcus hominis TaxID=1290 RepID=UPI003DA06324